MMVFFKINNYINNSKTSFFPHFFCFESCSFILVVSFIKFCIVLIKLFMNCVKVSVSFPLELLFPSSFFGLDLSTSSFFKAKQLKITCSAVFILLHILSNDLVVLLKPFWAMSIDSKPLDVSSNIVFWCVDADLSLTWVALNEVLVGRNYSEHVFQRVLVEKVGHIDFLWRRGSVYL